MERRVANDQRYYCGYDNKCKDLDCFQCRGNTGSTPFKHQIKFYLRLIIVLYCTIMLVINMCQSASTTVVIDKPIVKNTYVRDSLFNPRHAVLAGSVEHISKDIILFKCCIPDTTANQNVTRDYLTLAVNTKIHRYQILGLDGHVSNKKWRYFTDDVTTLMGIIQKPSNKGLYK